MFTLVISSSSDDNSRTRVSLPFYTNIPQLNHLLRLTLVCRYWRDVTLATKSLWSYIYSDKMRYLPITKHRWSENGKLKAFIGGPNVGSTIQELLDKEGGRIYSLRTDLLNVPQLSSILSFPADELRICHISRPRPTAHLEDATFPLFGGHAPKLEELYLEEIQSLPSTQFPALLHLVIDTTCIGTSRLKVTNAHFLAFLSGCPNLQTVHLCYLDAIGLRGGDAVIPQGKISLPKLRIFSIDEVTTSSMRSPRAHWSPTGPAFRYALLSHLQIPAECLVHLSQIRAEELEKTVSLLHPYAGGLTCMRIHTKDPRPNMLNTSRLENSWVSMQLVGAETDTDVEWALQVMGGVRIDVEIRSGSVAERSTVYHAVAKSPLFTNIHSLWISDWWNVFFVQPYPLLTALPRLTTLMIDHPLRPSFWCTLARQLLSSDDGDPVCPCLHTLAVPVWIPDQVEDLIAICVSRRDSDKASPIHRLVVMLETDDLWGPKRVAPLTEVVDEFTVIQKPYGWPVDLTWYWRVPRECRDPGKVHWLWPPWL